jgi:hypothetical protein
MLVDFDFFEAERGAGDLSFQVVTSAAIHVGHRRNIYFYLILNEHRAPTTALFHLTARFSFDLVFTLSILLAR